MDLSFSITPIFQPEIKEKIDSWCHYSEENNKRYINVINAIRFVLVKASNDMLDIEEQVFLDCVNKELSRITGLE